MGDIQVDVSSGQLDMHLRLRQELHIRGQHNRTCIQVQKGKEGETCLACRIGALYHLIRATLFWVTETYWLVFSHILEY